MTAEDDTYSTIFTALKHPIRRNILRRLATSPVSYTELLKSLGIENGLLNYHLESMHELIKKGEDGAYNLSEFGRAGLNLIQRVEEPPVAPDNHQQRQNLYVKLLGIVIIAILSFSVWTLYTGNQALEKELTYERDKVAVLQTTIQTYVARSATYKIIFSQDSYRVGDTINATLAMVNPTNQTILVYPPYHIRCSGFYEGDEAILERGVFISWISLTPGTSAFGGYEVLPEHAFDVWKTSFTAFKAGVFEVKCNDVIGTVRVYAVDG